MALGTRIAAGAATLALSLTGLAVATAPANAAPANGATAQTHSVSPDTFRMGFYTGSGGTVAIAQQFALFQAESAGYWMSQCSPYRTTGGNGWYTVTILCQAWN